MQAQPYPLVVLERFWAKVDKTADCWEWQAAIHRDGYGSFRLGGQVMNAHRAAYLLTHGSIPDGLVIDHLCENRLCVNPDHLEAVTQRVNVLRSSTSFARRYSEQTGCKCGHPLSGDNLYIGARGSRQCRECMRAKSRRQALESISEPMEHVLMVAERNGRWWLSGRGAKGIAKALERRGLVRCSWELLGGRARHYVVLTDAGATYLASVRERKGA